MGTVLNCTPLYPPGAGVGREGRARFFLKGVGDNSIRQRTSLGLREEMRLGWKYCCCGKGLGDHFRVITSLRGLTGGAFVLKNS